MLRRLALAVIRGYCIDCGGWIWPWQPRCRQSHSTCQHAAMLRLWRGNQAITPGIPLAMWECVACGVVPE